MSKTQYSPFIKMANHSKTYATSPRLRLVKITPAATPGIKQMNAKPACCSHFVFCYMRKDKMQVKDVRKHCATIFNS